MKVIRATSCEVSTKNQECVARGDATNWPQACSKKEARNEHVVMPTAWCDPVHRGSCTENKKRTSTQRPPRTCTSAIEPWDEHGQQVRNGTVSQEATRTMNCLLGHLKMTKKEESTPSTTIKTTCLCGRHRLQKASVSGPTSNFLRSSSHTTPVVHLSVCSTIFCRDFESGSSRCGNTARR